MIFQLNGSDITAVLKNQRTDSDIQSIFWKYLRTAQKKSENRLWYIISLLKISKNWSNNLLQNCSFFASYFMEIRGSSLRLFERNWKLKFFDSETFQNNHNHGFFFLWKCSKTGTRGYLISKIFKKSDRRLSKKLENCPTLDTACFSKNCVLECLGS